MINSHRDLFPRERVAVLLNANAKQVTPGVARSLSRLVEDGDIYFSRSLDEARDFTREIVARGYQTVCAGGGDGTVTNVFNDLFSTVDAHNFERASGNHRGFPTVSVLRLGTGNALANLLGAGAAHADLRRLRSGGVGRTTPLQLVEAEGRCSPFLGLGLDAGIINDHDAIKHTFLGKRLRFAASVVSRSIPAEARGRCRGEVEIVNRGQPAVRLDLNGNQVGEAILAGEVLYRGPAWIVGAATVPYYGYRFKMFPFALDRPGRMQLRIAWPGLAEALWHIRDIWQGRYQTKVLDFACDAVAVRFSRPMPFQVAGDAAGERSSLNIRVAPRTVDVVSFRPEFQA